jgi:hypothetical protein
MSGRGTYVLGENMFQCSFGHHKSQITLPGLEPRPSPWETSLAYGMTCVFQYNVNRRYSKRKGVKLSLRQAVEAHIVEIL